MRLTDLQKKVFLDRYALRDEAGALQEVSVFEMWDRVAGIVADAEKSGDKAYWAGIFKEKLLNDFCFIPGGRVLSAAPEPKTTLFNCFVLPSPVDSRSGIMDTATKMVEIMSRGGGVGVNLSTLRPRGSRVVGVNGTSSGSVQWGMVYDAATACVNQGGSRRGALMLALDVSHPDIVEFIEAKKTPGVLTNCNLSVAITDDFMEAVKNHREWKLHFEGSVYRMIPARELFNLICESAWCSGEPGVLFIDRFNLMSNTYYLDKITCCNPCGEQGLPPWGVCNLGSINLTKFIHEGNTLPNRVDWEGLRETVHLAVRFLDNVIDVTPYAFDQNRAAQTAARRVGLGTMGLADALIMLEERYGSSQCLETIDQLYGFIAAEAYVFVNQKGDHVVMKKGTSPDAIN